MMLWVEPFDYEHFDIVLTGVFKGNGIDKISFQTKQICNSFQLIHIVRII